MEPTFITLSTIFSYPLVGFRFTPQTSPCSYPFVWFILFFIPVEEWFFETFPLAVRLLLLLRPVDWSATLKRSKSRWQIADRLFIAISFVLSICSWSFAKIVMENMMNCLFCENVKLFALRISIDWKIWKRVITKI